MNFRINPPEVDKMRLLGGKIVKNLQKFAKICKNCKKLTRFGQ
jgi:hypothetical protein